jgi:hypothetical protein
LSRSLIFAVLLCLVPVSARGELSGVEANEALKPGTVRRVTWHLAEPPGPHGTEHELVLSLDGGATFPLRVSPEAGETLTEALFRVPNLPTPRARLGLRVGRDGKDERLSELGETFAILADPLAPLEPLRRRRGEAAMLEAAPHDVAEGLPASALAGAPSRVSARSTESDIDEDSGAHALPTPAESFLDAPPAGRVGALAPASDPPAPGHPFRPRRE